MADWTCPRGCGALIHLGKCGSQPKVDSASFTVAYVGGWVVKLNGVTVATGFDSRAEAQEWIDEQPG